MTTEARDVTLDDLAARIDELAKELRRQGRAAVAAQAAAEQCLEKLDRQLDEEAELDRADDTDEPDGASPVADAWLSAIIPVADALDRVTAQAATLARRAAEVPPRSLWSLVRPERKPDGDAAALHDGLRVLRSQLLAALESLGVTVDRRTGVAVDAERHRVVEVRGRGEGEIVAEVLRPGFRVGARILREADVIVERTARSLS